MKIAAKGHTLKKTEAKAATCTEEGNEAYWTCSVCHKLFSDENGTTETSAEAVKIAALGHTLKKTEAKAATCKDTGIKAHWHCTVCEKDFSDATGTAELTDITVPKDDDNHVGRTEVRDAKEATYKDEGYTGDTYCLGCGAKIADGTSIPKKTHSHSDSSDKGSSTYAIIIKCDKHGSVTSDRSTASRNTTVTLTVKPDEGYILETLTVTDKNGNELKIKEKNGKYTFTMPASKVTVEATFMEDNSMLNFFVDVPADAYYRDAVLWAAENGITGGTDAMHFSPNATCTRAQAVTFLWRAAGSPAPKSGVMPFTDVAAGAYYYDAVLWAAENGITGGTTATTFGPNATCSRAQIVTFLWRSQKCPAADTVNPFADVAADSYYANAVLWAAENGITGGTTATTFTPNNNCTRAQIVTFLYRCMK